MTTLNARRITITLLVLFAGFCFWNALPDQVSRDAASGLTASATAEILPTHAAPQGIQTQPIETIRVGQRVLAHNPEVSRSERRSWGPEPEFSDWLHLTLEMPKPDGSTLTIQLLRPEEWLEAQMSYVIRDRDIPADDRDIPADDGVAGVTTSDAVTAESLPLVADDQQQTQARPDVALIPTDLNTENCQLKTLGPAEPLSPLRRVFRDIIFTSLAAEDAGAELVGMLVQMDLPELGLTGEAIVTDIQAAPSIEPLSGPHDDRRIVTATFHHSSGDVIDLVVSDFPTTAGVQASACCDSVDSDPASGTSELNSLKAGLQPAVLNPETRNLKPVGEADSIGTTSNHPFWSVDRQEYVQAGQLRVGERLQTLHGDTKIVVSNLPRPGPKTNVYNLEVHAEHAYFVGEDGVLVHNSGNGVYAGRHRLSDPDAPFGRKLDGTPKAKPGPKTNPNAPQNAQVRAIIEEQTAKGMKHIGGGRAAGVGDLPEIEILTDGGMKSIRRMDASFQDPVTGRIVHFQVGQKNLRGDPVIRERQALLDVIRHGDGFKTDFLIKFREYLP